jgi:hypothetical protein
MSKTTFALAAVPNVFSQSFNILKSQKRFLLVVSILMAFTLTSSSQGNIAKRWQVAGRLVNGKLTPHKTKSLEYEFMSGSKFNAYENGTIVQSATYTMASDNKSLIIKDAGNTLPAKILKLTSNELNIQFGRSRNADTIICFPKAAASGAKAQQKNAAYRDARRYWNYMHADYLRRSQILGNVVLTINEKEGKENETFTPLLDLKKQTENYNDELGELTKAQFKEYENIQDKISKGSIELIAYIKATYPDLKASSFSDTESTLFYVDLSDKVAAFNAKLKISKANFIKAFNEYLK